MRRHLPIIVLAPLLTLMACGGSSLGGSARARAASPTSSDAATISADLIEVYDGVRVAGLEDRRFNHETYWNAVAPYLGGNVSSTRAGESVEGREIRHLTFGSGPCNTCPSYARCGWNFHLSVSGRRNNEGCW